MVEVDRRKAIASDLKACKAAFAQAEVPWVIADGIVLGYARYKDIMPWDTDLDIGVFTEISVVKWEALYNALKSNGFGEYKGSGIDFSNNKKDFICGYRDIEFNMWLYHKNGNYYESFPESTPGLKFVEKATWYDDPQIVDFLDSKYPMPNNIEDYLSCRYGNDWKTNIVKNHDEHFKDKRGGQDQVLWTKGRMGKHGDLWPKILKIEDNL